MSETPNPLPLLLDIADFIQARDPDEVIGPDDNPYLLRWFIVRDREKGNIYLHRFLRSDDDRALHCHPWSFRSFIIEGGYLEHLPGGKVEWRAPGTWSDWCPAEHIHRVELKDGNPALTLFFTGPHEREWGFHCPKGWVPWQKFGELMEDGSTRGCAP